MFVQIWSGANTAWLSLKSYLISKLMWNIDEDITVLTDRFFNEFYGSEAEEMKQIYFETRTLMCRNKVDLNFNTDVQNQDFTSNTAWWPKTLLSSWYDRMIAAEKRLIEAGEMTLADNVKREQMAPLFIMVDRYRLTYSENQLAMYKSNILELFDYFGYTNVGEGLALASAITTWN